MVVSKEKSGRAYIKTAHSMIDLFAEWYHTEGFPRVPVLFESTDTRLQKWVENRMRKHGFEVELKTPLFTVGCLTFGQD
jgi:hypothetical protein